jgi:hypothetical protein
MEIKFPPKKEGKGGVKDINSPKITNKKSPTFL